MKNILGGKMLSTLKSFGLTGIDGFTVDVEIDIVGGLPRIDIVGLGDTAVKESKERVKSAIRNSGLEFLPKSITLNLAPADIKKEGPIYDLAFAVGILSASEQITTKDYKDYIILGELSLDGKVKKVRGVLPMLISARSKGFRNFIIPKENENEASFIENINCYAFSSLAQVVAFLNRDVNKENYLVKTKRFADIASYANANKAFSNLRNTIICSIDNFEANIIAESICTFLK